MQDRLGRPLYIGEVVSVTGHDELSIKVNWIILGYIDHPMEIEVILKNFIDGSIAFVSILDIEKEFF